MQAPLQSRAQNGVFLDILIFLALKLVLFTTRLWNILLGHMNKRGMTFTWYTKKRRVRFKNK